MPDGLSDLGDDAAGLQVIIDALRVLEFIPNIFRSLANNSLLLGLDNTGRFSSLVRFRMKFQRKTSF